jgi:two-component system LytT family response regulator
MKEKLRVVIADDERPARSLLRSMLRTFDDVTFVGEAAGGAEAVELIERERPDLALLDLQMPEIDGLTVVHLLRRNVLPMIAFITAHDEYAVRAFDMNAVDYLLKPVDAARLRETIRRAAERLDRADLREVSGEGVRAALAQYEAAAPPLRRIPVRRNSDIILVPVEELATAVADGELLHLTTTRGEQHTITYRLKDLEARLEGDLFIRLSRGAIVNVSMIARVSPMPGGTYLLTLRTGQQLQSSRLHSRIVRERLLRL